MKKNDLIKYLTEIEGNPEVVVWEGLVGDWMHIGKLGHCKLYKPSFKDYVDRCKYEAGADEVLPTDKELRKSYKEMDWEFANTFVKDEMLETFYGKSKDIILLEPEARGKDTFDRIGEISY